MSDINVNDLQPVDNGSINVNDIQRMPDAVDYVLPTAISRLIHGSPASFGSGLNSTNMWGDLNRPAQGVRQSVLDAFAGKSPIKGFEQGYANPDQTSQSGIQDALLKNATPQTTSTLANFMGGLPASTLGVAGDIGAGMANPANALASLLIPGAAASKVGQFSPDQFIVDKTRPLIDKLRSNYVTNDILPRVNQLFTDAVNKFTPSIQDFAKNKMGIPQEVIDHISGRSVPAVEASGNALNNSADTVYQAIKNGFDSKDAEISKAYQDAFANVPRGTYISIPKAFNATTGFLENNKIIDRVGGLTEYGKQALSDDGSLNKVYGNYLLMRAQSGIDSTIAQRSNIAPVSPEQWTVIRNNFSKARNSTNYTSPITGILDALHEDAGDAGIPVQGARELKAQYEQMLPVAQKFTSDSGESKLNNIFRLPKEQVNNLQAVDKYLGTNSAQQAKDLVANKALLKLRALPEDTPFKPSLFENNLSALANVGGKGKADSVKNDFEGLLGKSSALDQIFKDLSFKRNQSVLAKALPYTEGAGLAGLAVLGYEKLKQRANP